MSSEHRPGFAVGTEELRAAVVAHMPRPLTCRRPEWRRYGERLAEL